MRWLRAAALRLWSTLRPRQDSADDLGAEMRAHLEMETDENIRRGMSPAEARRRALIASGGFVQAAEEVHGQRGLPWLEGAVADVRYALRFFLRSPGLAVTMLFVLSLGIGSSIVLFTVLNAVATMAAPGIERQESLVRIRGVMRMAEMSGDLPRLLSWPEVREYATQVDLFSDVAAYVDASATFSTDAGELHEAPVRVLYTTSNYFPMLGIDLAAGRQPVVEPDETRAASVPNAVISYSLSRERFGAATEAVGRFLRVNGASVQISGVAPRGFRGTEGGNAHAVWIPIGSYPHISGRSAAVFSSPDSTFLSAVARLRPGVELEDAGAAVSGIGTRFFNITDAPAARSGSERDIPRTAGTADVVPLLATNRSVGDRNDTLVSVSIAASLALLILIITCVNVSTLLVGLGVSRRREISVRLSLGAPRSRIIRQLLTESVLLALVAAGIGLLVTSVSIPLIETRVRDLQLVVNWRVALATCAVAIVTGILFGLSPALHAIRCSVNEALRETASSITASTSWLQRALVVAQIAFTQPLLVGLGVLVLSMGAGQNGRASSPAGDRIVSIELDVWGGEVSSGEVAARMDDVVRSVAAIPGVETVVPMQSGAITVPLEVHPEDRIIGVSPEGSMETRLLAAPEGHFSAFEIPIVRGRDFNAGERMPAPDDGALLGQFQAIIIGSDLAQRLWRGADPIGRRFRVALPGNLGEAPLVVVGIVDEDAAGAAEVNGQMRAFVPYSPHYSGVVVRTSSPAMPMLNQLRRVVSAAAPQMPIVRAQTLAHEEAELKRSLAIAAAASAGGGLLALLLSGVGLYAVVSFAVRQRTREIGIRTALGAPPHAVVKWFFTRGFVLSGLGVLIGLPLSMVGTQLLASVLRLPVTTSWVMGAAVGTIVMCISALAVWIPARRASAVAPVQALRCQ